LQRARAPRLRVRLAKSHMIAFEALNLTAPDGGIIGVLGQVEHPACHRIRSGEPVPEIPGNYILEHPLATADAVTRARAISQISALGRAGATLVLITWDEALLEQCADEVWWLGNDGRLILRGHPAEVLPEYRRHTAAAIRAAGAGIAAPLAPSSRAGDGRAELHSVELLNAEGQPATVWQSGEAAVIKVIVGFTAEVADPVIGILIRTRIGLNVYGTNTELEQLHPGPLAAGETLTVTFRFRCDLCPGDYTVTAASHDPDGVWHDWQEDAVAFAVTDSRYTAGVANLRAKVVAEVQRIGP
ncbi:MAG: Wzt carbohydrate-binding domain-containing protein, partial [Terriglobia bacterium]